jgi:hypothetical protein
VRGVIYGESRVVGLCLKYNSRNLGVAIVGENLFCAVTQQARMWVEGCCCIW